MARTSKRERALRPSRPSGGAGYLFLAVFLLLLTAGIVALVWGPIRTAITAAAGVFRPPLPTATPAGPATPGPPPPTVAPLSRALTILLIGIDRREEGSHTLNDVNIVVYIHPEGRFASMLSIPRDTAVEIPGFLTDKVNAAYGLGEAYLADAGGGPALIRKTVENFLGLSIDYYALVDFQGFERIVDLVGGITVDVPAPLEDNEYPIGTVGYTRIYIPAGLQHMDARTALQYVRSRHGDSDFGRNRRQQQVLRALRDRILQIGLLSDLGRLEALLVEMGNTVQTDLPLDTLLALARLAPDISAERISSYTLDTGNCLSEISGTTRLYPSLYCVRAIVQEMQQDPVVRRVREEAARVEVRNGTLTCNLCAARTRDYLVRRGFNVVEVLQDPQAGTYTRTLVLDGGDHPFTRQQLAALLHVQPGFVRQGPVDSSYADIVIILGDDYTPPQE
ncbi:MAG: LCP family protein [Chloroflexia bacterium]